MFGMTEISAIIWHRKECPAWCSDEHDDELHTSELLSLELEAFPYTIVVPARGHRRAVRGVTRYHHVLATIEQAKGLAPQIVVTAPDAKTEIRMSLAEAEEFIDMLSDLADLLTANLPTPIPAE